MAARWPKVDHQYSTENLCTGRFSLSIVEILTVFHYACKCVTPYINILNKDIRLNQVNFNIIILMYV